VEAVYRRIPRDAWDDDGKPQIKNFRLRQQDEGLSVYDVERPRLILEALLESQRRKLTGAVDDRDRDRRKRWFLNNGETPEELVENGWGIVAVATASIVAWGFVLGSASQTGHLEIEGQRELFDVKAADMRELARVLSRRDCLR
jgi:hypothetical protein